LSTCTGRSKGILVADGGNGGPGGDVVLVADPSIRHLWGLRTNVRGQRGGDGGRQGLQGGRASPEVLRVPVGTVVHEVPAATDPLDAAWAEFEAERGDGARYQSSAELGMGEAEEGFETGQEWDEVVQHFGWDTGEVREELLAPGTEVEDEDLPVLADLSAPCDRVVVARGGAGGKGSLLLKRPGVSLSEIDTEERLGRPGEERKLRLLLKLLGDVGLVGLPNVGKSSLLRELSRADPVVADYPFTTLTPNVGVLESADGASTTVVDVPGLVPGAHLGRGLGHQFLRHVERCRALVLVVDASGGLGSKGARPWTQLQQVMRELERYESELGRKVALVCATKVDLLRRPARTIAALKERAGALPVFPVSSATREGLDKLAMAINIVSSGLRQSA